MLSGALSGLALICNFFEEKFLPSPCLPASLLLRVTSYPIQDGPSRGCSKDPLPKICHTYPTMIKLNTVIPYLREIQKIFE